ncbi:gonadotropin-releasing hormone II receptor-like [Cheilinus undulatus]|uniref:gonadotropin-releasing hormone II receptor-like n=1 Tax=Cheilinus undulatus TaxID=241271 RepID=UPI001BD1CAA5|nr:gonadotropin-releasing hormone II receptor-like [Cheilinus undulatus]
MLEMPVFSTGLPGLAVEKLPHSMMLPPPCFTVEMVCLCMSGDWPIMRLSSHPPPLSPNTSQFPALSDWEAPSFTRAAQFRVGATFILFLFAACSNLALLVSLWCGRGRRLASHLRPLMLSLASADLMMTFVVMPLDAVWNVTVQWYGGDVLCKLLCFLKLFAMHAAAFILVVISLDRQHAILHPLDALSAHHRNRRMLLMAWSLSVLLASPQDPVQAVQSFRRAAESYHVAAVLDFAAVALKEAGSHMVQSD